MAAPSNVELEAAKFLHKLIQESKDEPTKLATKLYVILQHMRSSGKENSMPYQVISRAMETVINQHGLDIDALISSRIPLTTGTQVGDSASSQFGGSSLRGAVSTEASSSLASSEQTKVDAYASNRPPVGPNSAGHDIYQGSVSHLNSKSLDHESPSSFDTRPAKSQSEERFDSPNWEKAKEKDNKKVSSKRKRADPSLTSERQFGNLQPLDSSTFSSGMDKVANKIEQPRSLSIQGGEHGQFNNMIQSSSQTDHSALLTSAMKSVLRAKQETQHQAEKSLDSANVSTSLSRASHSRHPEEIEVSSAHNALGLQQGGSLSSTHDVLNSRGLWNQNKIGLPYEKSQVPRFSFHAGGGNSSTETLMHQSAASPLGSGAASNVYGMTPGTSGPYVASESGIPSPAQFSSSYDTHGLGPKMPKDRSMGAFSGAPSVEFPSEKGTAGKALEHEGGILHSSASANNTVQGGMLNSVTEMTMLRSTGKSPVSQAPSASGMPFKEQHLKQLRAQCLVFLAFRSGLMPKKLHLDIALGNFFPREDGPSNEMIDHKGKEQSIDGPSSTPNVTMPFGRLGNPKETERSGLGSSSVGMFAEGNLSKEGDSMNMVGDKNGVPLGLPEHGEERRQFLMTRRKPESEMQTWEIPQSQLPATKGDKPDGLSLRGSAINNHKDDLENRHWQVGSTDQSSLVMGMGQQMKTEMSGWTGNGCHDETSKVSPLGSAVLSESVPERKDNAQSQSFSLGDRDFQGSQHADAYLPSFPLRVPVSRMDGGNLLLSQDDTKISHQRFSSDGTKLVLLDNALQKTNPFTVMETDQEEGGISASTDMPPSPKYTTSERWIADQQRRKLLIEKTWALKQQKTEQRITACSDKLKDTVSSSEDISAKTRSVIELKKLQLLELQRRLKNDILVDFFKPISSDMDRLKSIKKHRIGRRSKQLEKFEQKMKEERQKRFRERQKEFFSEIEVHKERLEDVFKMRRERWKGFNKYVREFHKRKERAHREKIDRIQREKINLLKINDVEGYLRMVQDAKSDRVKQLLKETEKYLLKLGSKLRDAKAMSRCFETEMDDNRNDMTIENEDETDQAKHYLESNEKYYLMAHSIKENVADQPSSLVGGKLREYQMNGLRWLVSLYNNHLNGILADEMGLGKTVQVISLICYLMENKNDRGPFLVVVPSSVLPGWDSEINFWAPSINKIVYSGPPEERRRLFKERIVPQKFNVLLTTYEYLMNKHDRPKLSKIHWHYVIIDEGHRIKNASCKLNADLKQYRSSHRLLLTGTPLQNNLEELWALLNFLLPNIFNSSEDFSQWFNKPFESSGDSSPDEALLSEEENLLIINRLHQVLRPFVLRRLKHKVENELPEKIERLVRCEASAYQKLLMKRVEENLGAIGTSKARSVHNSVMELRNICNHPYLSQLHVEEVHDFIPTHYLPNIVRLCGKLEMLDRLLPKLKATDHRVLLFSTMTRLLDVMEDYLCWKQYKYLRLDGHTSGGDRGALIDQFNKPGSPYFIFLLSIRAGGVGVNLQAADTVIIFDTDWNPQVDLQAQARAHRIGQKREVLVLRFETVQTVEEQVRAAAEHKLGVANQSITAGFFDNNTSAEDRREYLESLLRECKKEEVAPVLHDDALNDLIARSESEIDVFESIDKRRQEEEMATWKLILGQGTNGSDPVFSLPSRLLTVDDLKPFCEAMKLSDTPTPVVVSSLGVKRKSEYLGGLDTQHYGRGKRAREVRSYEEQWTEDEFEKMCQVESPQSPKLKDEVKDLNLQMVANESFKVTVKTEAMVPSEQPTQSPLELSAVPPLVQLAQPPLVQSAQPPLVQSAQPLVQSGHPPPQQPVQPPPLQPVQHPLPQPTQQSKEGTPPSKRGRGRPKRATSQISPSQMVVPAPSAASSMDVGSHRGTISTCPVAHGSDSSPSSATVTSITGTSHQFGVLIAPSSQASTTLPSASPGTQPTAIPCPSVPIPDKRRGRKAHQGGGETPRRRGRKPSAVSSATSVLPSPPGTVNSTVRSQGEIFSSSPFASGPDLISGLVSAKAVIKEADSLSPVPVLLPSSGTVKLGIESQEPVSSSPILSSSSILTGIRGTTHDLSVGTSGSQTTLPLLHVPTNSQSVSVGIDPSSQPNPPFSVPLGPQSVPPSDSVPNQVKGRGCKAQSEVEAPRRRGRKQGAVTTVVPDRSVGEESTSIEPPEKKSRVSGGRKAIATRSKQQNEAQKLMNVIQSEASKVHTFDGFAGLDTALTEESYDSAQNKQGTSSSVAVDVAAKSPDNASANVKVSQLDASVNSRDGTLSTKMESCESSADPSTIEIHDAGVKDVAPAIKEVTSDTQSSEVKICQSSRIEGGDVLTLGVSKPSLLEASVTQSLDSKTYSALSTLGTESVCDLTIGMCGTQSGKEGVEKVEEMTRVPSGEIVTPNPEIDDSESKRKADVLVSSTTVSEQLTDVRSGTGGDLGGPTTSDTLTNITENQSLEDRECSALSTLETMTLTQSSDSKTNSALSTLETDLDSDFVKVGSPSEKEGGEKVEAVVKPLLDGSVAPTPEVHKSESQRNAADCVQNVADPDIFIEERSFDDNGKSVEEKNSVMDQVVSYAEDKPVAVNDAMVVIKESVNSYEEKVALDRKGKAVVRNLGAEYTSETAVGLTNAVTSDEDGAGIVGEKLLVVNDVMLSDGKSVAVYAGEQLDATVDAVVSPKDSVKDYVAREGVEAEREFEAKELSESKGESGGYENKVGKHDLASGGTMDVGASISSEELEEVIHVVTEHEARDRPGAGELHGIAETAIEIHHSTMNLLVGQDESLVEEGKCAGAAEYNKQGEFKSEVERLCLDTKEENDDLAAVESTKVQIEKVESTKVQIEKEPSKDDMGVFQGETQHGRREQQGDAILHAAIGETVVEIGQASKEILIEQGQVKEVGYTGISKDCSKEADFKQVERGCLEDTKEENDDLAAVESSKVQIEKEPSKDDMGVFQGETQHGRREQQGDAILHAAIGETVVEIGQTSKEILIEQGQVKEVGYTGISKDCSKETDFKQVEKLDPEFVEVKHHLSETGIMEGSKAKPSEKVELVSQKVIQNEKREQEGRVVDANRETITEFGETRMEVDGGLGQTRAEETGGYTGDLEECSNQEDLEEFRQEVWQDEKGVHETTEKRHDPAAGDTIESEETKPSENGKEVYEGVTNGQEEKEQQGRGVFQATGDAIVEIKQTMEELLMRQCLTQAGEEVFQHASEPERRDHGGEALHTTEETIIEQTQNELVEQCQIREDKAKIFEKVKAVFEEIIQHERREQQGGGVLHATVEDLAKIGQTAKEINVDHCQTQAEVRTDEKVEAFLEATEPERTEHVEGRVFLAVGETVTEFGLTKEELLVEHHTQAEQIIPCKNVEVFQGESAHDRREQHEDRVLHAGARSTAEFGKTTEEHEVLCQPEAKEAKPDEKADDIFQEATEHERREHLEGGVWQAIVETVGKIRQTMEEPLVEPCQFLAEQAKPSEIVEEVLHAGAETIVEIGQIAEEVPVEQCQTLAKDDSEDEVPHAAAETIVEIEQRSEELPVEQCQTRAQEDSELSEKVEEVLHAAAETTVDIGQRLEELPVEQCQIRAQENSEFSEKVEEVLHAGAETTVEIGQIAEEVPVEQCQTRAKEDSEVEVLHAGADTTIEIGQRSEELPVEQCQTRAQEDSEFSEKVEVVLHAGADTTVEIGQRLEELPVEQCQTQAQEDSEKVEEVLRAGVETTVEIGQLAEELPVEQCQTRAKEDSEPSKIVEVLHAGAETTAEIGQRSEDLPVEHCQTRAQVDSEFSEKVEEVLHAGAETTVGIGQRLEELPVEQCETREKEDSEPSERMEEHVGAKTTVEIEQILEELPVEQCQIQAEEDLELSEKVEEVLHADAENKVQIGQRLEELPIEQSQTRVKEDSELSEKVEEVLQEENAHDSRELQGDRVLHVGAETTVEIGRLKELPFKHSQNQAEDSESSEKIEVFREATEYERREQLEAGAAKVRLTTDQLFGECQAQVEAAKPSEEVEEVLQEEYAQNRRLQHGGRELHAGADTTVDIGQRSEELPVEHCQARAKEDFEPAEKAEEGLHEGTEHERRVELGSRLLHAIEETTGIVGQNMESLVGQSRTQAEEPVKLSDKVEVFQKAIEHERMEQQESGISRTPGETNADSGKMKLEGLVECQTELKEAGRPDEVKEVFLEGTLNEEMVQAGIVLHSVGETLAEIGKLTKDLIESGETQEKGSASKGSSEDSKKGRVSQMHEMGNKGQSYEGAGEST